MPFKREKYPSDWEEFSRFIRLERAQNKCEKCGVPNYAIIYRIGDDWDYFDYADDEFLGLDDRKTIRGENGYSASKLLINEHITHLIEDEDEFESHLTVIMLTVAHLDQIGDICKCESQTGMKCAIDSHVLALCQRCHLLYNIERHKFNRRRNQAKKVGQLWLADWDKRF